MTQVEFEQRIKEMRAQKAVELQSLQVMINDVKERQNSKRQLLHEIHEQLAQLEKERIVISKRMSAIIDEYSERIGKFTRENYTETRTLENISEWALVKELNKRGYCGHLCNVDKTTEFLDHLNSRLNHDDEEEDSE